MMRKLAYYLIIGLLSIVSILPLKVHYFFADITAFFLHKVIRYRYSTIVTNIARSFPEMRYGDIKKLTKKYYAHLADIIAEAIWAYGHSTATIGKRTFIEGTDDLNRACDLNKNVIIMMGHTGNWEVFTGLPSLRDVYGINLENNNFVYAYKRQRSKLSEMLIERIRNKHKTCSTVDTKNIVRHILENRKGRNVYFLICDQNPEKSKSNMVVDFLNQKTYMIEGPEKIAAKLGMPIVYCGLYQIRRKKNVARFEMICEDASKCEPGEATKIYVEKLQRDINNYKESWLWSHKRWKKYIA